MVVGSLIDVSELMDDPEMAQPFTVRRPTGSFGNEGIYTKSYKTLALVGPVQPAGPEAAKIVPEGTRLDNLMCFYSVDQLSVGDGKNVEADIVQFQGDSFKVVKVLPWGNNGYWCAYAEGYVP